MSRSALIARLQSRIGLDPQSLGTAALDHAIDEACASLGCSDAMGLLIEVERSAESWQRFIDCMVIPETWFFRVPEQFEDLKRFAQARRPMRVLSLPSATGEEAYSIAIALLEAGLSPGAFDVLGIDVGARQVAHARRGRYGLHSFRGNTPAPEWFVRDGNEYLVAPAVKRTVRFQVGNILDANLFGAERFDAIFFRNLLIYLDTASRKLAVQQLIGSLEPAGIIFAGQAEVLSSIDTRLQPANGYGALTFALAAAASEAPTPRPATPRPLPPARPRVRVKAAPAVATPVEDALQRARNAADSGDLDAARGACRDALARDPESADVWFLLGMIETAAGRFESADDALLRATYLNRNHTEALFHRAALADRMGRNHEAAQLRARLKRVGAEVAT